VSRVAPRAPHAATLVFEAPSEAEAAALAGALGPEVGDEVPKTRGALARDGARVTLDLAAEDVPSLRAAVNSYLRWARTALDAAAAARRP